MPRRLLLLALLAAGTTAGAAVGWRDISRQKSDWYASAEATAIAGSIAQYQTKEGGWPKNTDMTLLPTKEFLENTKFDHRAPTIDNGGTTTQLHFLAQVMTAAPDEGLRTVFNRGLDYLLAAQYPSGGWPQYFPLIKGYYTHITYNDNAMANVILLLREVGSGQAPYAFVDEARRAKAAAAVAKGLACILRSQVKQDGKLTVWCAQHDEVTLAPAWARNFEPPTLSGSESLGLLRLLMEIERPTPEIIAAVEGATAWFKAVAISGMKLEDFTGADGKRDKRIVADPAAPLIWARFYELGTNKPVFTGRDKVIRYALSEIEYERRNGYAYYGAWPANLLSKDYARWRAKNKLP